MIDWTVTDTDAGFAAHREPWQAAWETSFERPLPPGILKRYFLEPPSGAPVMILGHSEGKLVAGSTLVPLMLRDPGTGRDIRYFQYISAFILPAWSNGFNTYREMVGQVTGQLRTRPDHDFILSFPNRKARTLMIKLGGFSQLDTGYFIRGTLGDMHRAALAGEAARPGFAPSVFDWRVQDGMTVEDPFVYKLFEGEKNLLDVTGEPGETRFEGLLPWWQSWGDAPTPPVDDYRLNLCVYGDVPDIRRSFLLSDVF